MFKFDGLYKCVSTQHFVWGTRALFALEGADNPSQQNQICIPCPAGKVVQIPEVGKTYSMGLRELIDGDYSGKTPDDVDADGQDNPPTPPGPGNHNSSPPDPGTDAEGEPDPIPGASPEAQPEDSER